MSTGDERLARLNELLDAAIAKEIAAHGFLRPPWLLYPGEHPFSIAWRMGSGEDQVMRWTRWLEGRDATEVVAAIRHFGAVPADWSWWAAEVVGLVGAHEVDDVYEVPFEQVREKLAFAGSPSMVIRRRKASSAHSERVTCLSASGVRRFNSSGGKYRTPPAASHSDERVPFRGAVVLRLDPELRAATRNTNGVAATARVTAPGVQDRDGRRKLVCTLECRHSAERQAQTPRI